MIKKILISQDGSPNSKAVLECGIWLAGRFDAALTGLHVVDIVALEGPIFHDLSGSLGFEPFLNFSSRMKELLETNGRSVLEMFDGECKKAGVNYDSSLLTGIVPKQICERARLADLVVLGRRGVNASFEYVLLGSVVEGVIRRSSKPVLIVPETFTVPTKPLVAFDKSLNAGKALRSAAEFAKVLATGLTVVTAATDGGGGEILKDAEDYLKPYEIEVDFVCLKGEDPSVIEKYYLGNGCDMLFIGATHHTRLVEMVLGSTAEHLLRKLSTLVFLER